MWRTPSNRQQMKMEHQRRNMEGMKDETNCNPNPSNLPKGGSAVGLTSSDLNFGRIS